MPIFLTAITDLLKQLRLSASLLIPVLCYVRRVSQADPVCHGTIFRLLLASTLLAIKCFDDGGITNAAFARFVTLDPADIAALEYGLLRVLRYRAAVDATELAAMDGILRRVISPRMMSQGRIPLRQRDSAPRTKII